LSLRMSSRPCSIAVYVRARPVSVPRTRRHIAWRSRTSHHQTRRLQRSPIGAQLASLASGYARLRIGDAAHAKPSFSEALLRRFASSSHAGSRRAPREPSSYR
jgi:hypothetical protein